MLKKNFFQRDETSNTSTPTKMLPIDQIISHITNAGLTEKQPPAPTPTDAQVPQTATESAEASRRSSTSTQNTDTLTPTNPVELLDNQESIISTASAMTVLEVDSRDQESKTEIASGIPTPSSSELFLKATQEVDGIAHMSEAAGRISYSNSVV